MNIGRTAALVLPASAAAVRLFWLDGRGAPKCESAAVR